MIGQMLGTKYRIEKKLGSGSFGDVYRALHTQLEKAVAIKILSGGGEHATRREAFLRESRTMAKLTHPNVATVFDVGEHEGHPYIVMEFVEGLSLSERLEESELDLLTVLAIAIQVGG